MHCRIEKLQSEIVECLILVAVYAHIPSLTKSETPFLGQVEGTNNDNLLCGSDDGHHCSIQAQLLECRDRCRRVKA